MTSSKRRSSRGHRTSLYGSGDVLGPFFGPEDPLGTAGSFPITQLWTASLRNGVLVMSITALDKLPGRALHTGGVTGSIPVAPTSIFRRKSGFSLSHVSARNDLSGR